MPDNTLAPYIVPYSKASANRASIALKAYRRATGTDSEDALSDLLADLMHLCLQTGQDFDQELARARFHFGDEKAGCF